VFELDLALTSHVGQSHKLENLQRIIALGSRVDVDDIGDTFLPENMGTKTCLTSRFKADFRPPSPKQRLDTIKIINMQSIYELLESHLCKHPPPQSQNPDFLLSI
jgi:hypothetical protein